MPNILITGAGSGIGKGFVSFYLRDPSNHIIAVDRSFPPEPASPLTAKLVDYVDSLGQDTSTIVRDGRLRMHLVDITISDQLSSMLRDVWNLDLVIHSAGVRGLVRSIPVNQPSDVAAAETLAVMDTTTLIETLSVNVIGTFNLLRELVPRFRTGAQGKVVIMGSRMGSIALNAPDAGRGGGAYAYRASKAALNAIVRSFAVDVRELTFVIVHPGRIDSGLCRGVREEGGLRVDEVIEGLTRLVAGFEAADSGRFVDRFGVDVPW